MMSKPASVTSHQHESARDEPPAAAKIPLKPKGLDLASQMRSVKLAEPDPANAVGDCSTSVGQTLGFIEAIEATLQQKRTQIEEIQARQEILALEYRKLGRSLDTATKDLAQQFSDIIADLKSDKATDPPAETVPETSEARTDPPAETAPETSKASDLKKVLSDLPPVPEFLGGGQDSLDQKDDSAPRDLGSSSRPWWKHGKKG